MWLLIGIYALPIYATLLNITGVSGSLLNGFIQKKVNLINKIKLIDYRLFMEIISTLVYFSSIIVLLNNFQLGIIMFMIGSFIWGITNAICYVQQEKFLNDIFTEVELRIDFKANIQVWTSISMIFGLFINLIIMYIFNDLDKTIILKNIVMYHGIFSLIDLILSIIERNMMVSYYKEEFYE